MMQKCTIVLLAAAWLLFAALLIPAPSWSATQIFVQMDGIEGDSSDPGHQDWIDAFTYDESLMVIIDLLGPGRTGRTVFSPIKFSKYLDKASPWLREYAANGRSIPTVEIEFVKSPQAGAQLFYEVILNDVIIAAIKSGGASSESRPTEELTINFGSVSWRFVSQTGDDTSGGSGGGVSIGDVDDDGFTVSQGDCNDLDAGVNPDATEICDGQDNDCDREIDEGFTDLAAECFDGIGECETAGSIECTDDGTATQCGAVAGAPVAEICDDLDNDCDGQIDNSCCPDVNDLAARAKSGKVSLIWTHVGADSYNILRSETQGGPYTLIANTTSTYATYLDEDVTNGTPYYYQVRSVCNSIEGGTSNETSAMPTARVRR